MGYSEENFKEDMRKAAYDAYNAVSVTNLETDLIVPHLVPYYIGDKSLKRELQILLDKFENLFEKQGMYDGLDHAPPSDKEYEYAQRAKHLASMIDKKLANVIVFSEKKTYVFTNAASHDRTRALIEDVQLIIDLM